MVKTKILQKLRLLKCMSNIAVRKRVCGSYYPIKPRHMFYVCPKPEPGFPSPYVMFFLTFNDLGGILLFVFFYMGEIVDHYCLNFVSFHYYFVSKYSLFCMPHVAWIYNYLCNQCLSHQSCELEPRSW